MRIPFGWDLCSSYIYMNDELNALYKPLRYAQDKIVVHIVYAPMYLLPKAAVSLSLSPYRAFLRHISAPLLDMYTLGIAKGHLFVKYHMWSRL